MHLIKKILPLLFLLCFNTSLFSQNEAAMLGEIIKEVQERKSYDKDDYPLGIYTKEHYRREAQFAKEKLDKLATLDKSRLSESEKISAELLKFRLKETVDVFEYEAFLNPLLSDAGFHVSLPYHVRELANYGQVKAYLNKLNAMFNRV